MAKHTVKLFLKKGSSIDFSPTYDYFSINKYNFIYQALRTSTISILELSISTYLNIQKFTFPTPE